MPLWLYIYIYIALLGAGHASCMTDSRAASNSKSKDNDFNKRKRTPYTMKASLSPMIERSSVEQCSRLQSPTQIRLSPLEAANYVKIPDLALPSPVLPISSDTGEFDTLCDLEDVAAEASSETASPNLGGILNYIQRQMARARAQDPRNSGINELAVDMVSLVIEELAHMGDDEKTIIDQETKIGHLEEYVRAYETALARKENIIRRQAATIVE